MQCRNQTGTGTTTEGRSGPPGRARYLKAELRVIFQLPCKEAVEAIDKWVVWARQCRILALVKLQRTIMKHREALLAAIEHGLSNGRVESMNTKFSSASHHPTRSSHWPCSALAATKRCSPPGRGCFGWSSPNLAQASEEQLEKLAE